MRARKILHQRFSRLHRLKRGTKPALEGRIRNLIATLINHRAQARIEPFDTQSPVIFPLRVGPGSFWKTPIQRVTMKNFRQLLLVPPIKQIYGLGIWRTEPVGKGFCEVPHCGKLGFEVGPTVLQIAPELKQIIIENTFIGKRKVGFEGLRLFEMHTMCIFHRLEQMII
jgi:hypothetical protein